ncbi:MAG TPA: MerR family transcriptional regulator [Acidimicrobiia bacterium]|jgi:DNA-binding transcriptional MerR regulator
MRAVVARGTHTVTGDAGDGHEATAPGLSLEALAEATGVAPRTIRYYQGEKLLPKPERDPDDGRVARYGSVHVERLRLIGELRDRGLRLPAIRTLLNVGDTSTRVADWLGLDASLRGAWGRAAPRVVTRPELVELLVGTPSGTQGALEDARLVVREGRSWLIPDPGLLELTLRLVIDGVRIDLVVAAGAILQKHLGKAAAELVDLFIAALGEGFGHGVETTALVDALRPAADDAARMIFEQQLERAIDALLADTKRLGAR